MSVAGRLAPSLTLAHYCPAPQLHIAMWYISLHVGLFNVNITSGIGTDRVNLAYVLSSERCGVSYYGHFDSTR